MARSSRAAHLPPRRFAGTEFDHLLRSMDNLAFRFRTFAQISLAHLNLWCLASFLFWMGACQADAQFPGSSSTFYRDSTAPLKAASVENSRRSTKTMLNHNMTVGEIVLTELREIESKVQSLLPQIHPAVVSIEGGSGFIVNESGLVITVSHVTQRAGRKIQVQLSDGTFASGVTLGSNRATDTGAVQLLGDKSWPHLKLGDPGQVESDQWCLALGYPLSAWTRRRGYRNQHLEIFSHRNGRDTRGKGCSLYERPLNLPGSLISKSTLPSS